MDRQELLREIKRRLECAFGDRFRGALLYGSEARGEAAPDSDIDVMVLLEGPVRLWDDIGRGVEATYDLALDIGRPIHPGPVNVDHFDAAEFALYRTVKAEGVPL